ncbi:MAG TPA: hypothetical protein VFY03_11185 [Woeseiaceae bacterium]|nr:hypothetical protein [Woeseiaceae bacterium]
MTSMDEQGETRTEEMICGLTADERTALLARLASLPETMPPRAVWHRIREQAEAEGLLRRPASPPRTLYWGAGLAAAVGLVAVLVLEEPAAPTFSPTPENYTVSNSQAVDALAALMVESRQLENDLRALPAEPRVVRAGTQATILELEERIASIDQQLSDPASGLSAADREVFWRERVRLMKLLVGLRYAQTQRAAFSPARQGLPGAGVE